MSVSKGGKLYSHHKLGVQTCNQIAGPCECMAPQIMCVNMKTHRGAKYV